LATLGGRSLSMKDCLTSGGELKGPRLTVQNFSLYNSVFPKMTLLEGGGTL